MYTNVVLKGGEGIILRDLKGRYKHGRCTPREGNMFKLKAMKEADAIVVGVEPAKRLNLDAEVRKDAFGSTKRSFKKGEHHNVEALGALVAMTEEGIRFNCGTGFHEQGCSAGDVNTLDRWALWRVKDQLIGRWFTFKSQGVGVKEKPRMPVFLRWRDPK